MKGEIRLLSKAEIMKYLEQINEQLKERNQRGEICLFGGAVMCLVFESRDSTKDVDAIFAPTSELYTIIKNIADEHRLPSDWLNNAVKGFVSHRHDVRLFRKMSHLDIYAASPEYMMAMKCLAARTYDSKDVDDIRFLLRHLNIQSVEQALAMIVRYYPQNRVLPKTAYLLEELLSR
jgi:predicted nucleotidyltransferase